MIFRKLTVKSFAGLNPGVEIPDFGPEISVIHGPNESGKSTLFRAIEYVLYQRYGSKGAEFEKEILPAGTKVTPEVVLEFLYGTTEYRVTKRFLKSASAVLEQKMAGGFAPIAEGEDVDQKLAQMLGHQHAGRGKTKSDAYGIGQILLVPQTAIALPETLGAPALEGLRGVIKEVASGGEMLDLQKRVRKEYEKWFTPQGGKKSASDLGQAIAKIDETKQALSDLTRRRDDSEARERTLMELDRPDAETDLERRTLAEGKAKAQALYNRHVEAKAAMAPLEKKAKDAEALRDRLAADLDRLILLLRERGERTTAVADAQARKERAFAESERRRGEEERAEALLKTIEAEVVRLSADESAPRDAREARRLEAHAKSIAEKDALWLAADRDHREAVAALAARPRPSSEELRQIERETHALEAADRALLRLSLGVAIEAERPIKVVRDEKERVVEPGAAFDLRGPEPLVFLIPGVGRFTVTGPPSKERDQAEADRRAIAARLEAARRPFGTADLAQLESLTNERTRLESARDAAQKVRGAHFPRPEDRERAAIDKTSALASLEAILLRRAEWGGNVPSDPHVTALEREIAERRRQLDERKKDAERARREAKEEVQRLAKEAEAATNALIAAQGAFERVAAEIARLEKDCPDPETGRARLDEARRTAEALEAERRERARDLEAMGDPAQALAIANAAADLFEQTLVRRAADKGRIEGEPERLRGENLAQKIAEAEERLADLLEDQARFETEAAATALLLETLEAAQSEVIASVVRPVSERVVRMAHHVFGRRVTPTFGDNYLPAQVALHSDQSIAIDQLSVGARDQLLLLTRLAFAEVYAKKHGRQAFVLDDPFVNTDRERRGRMLEILMRASRDLQIIVFTCHPEHFPPTSAVKLIPFPGRS